MKKNILFLLLSLFIFSYLFILTTPVAWAVQCSCYCGNSTTPSTTINSDNPDVDCGLHCNGLSGGPAMNPAKPCSGNVISQTTGGSSGQVVLKDPLNLPGGDPQVFWARIIGGLLAFVGVGALVTFIYAGFMFLTSSGNPEQVKKAKDTMVYAVLGVAVSMGAYVILGFIFDTLQGSVGQR
ncbi:hypothetical protein GYA13_04235 [Candidatus Kuenenbacteria bacterium]|nr:hypothetical protein [Candidatus Kuenenbacteria bacterium]